MNKVYTVCHSVCICWTHYSAGKRYWFDLSHLMTKPTELPVHAAMTLIRLGGSESSLCAQWVAKDPRFLHADSEYSDQTWQMPRLIWVFAGRKGHFVGFCHEAAHFRMITAIFSGVWIFRISTVGLFTSLPKNEKTTDYMRNMYTSWHKSVNGNPTETTSIDTADTVFQLSYLWNWRKWLHYVGDLDGCLKGRWFYYIHKWDVLCDFGSCWGPKSSADNMNLRETS